MGSLFKPDVQDTTTRTELPPWMNQYGQWLTGSAQQMVGRPYTPYEGQRFAGFNPMQQDAMGTANAFGGMALPALGGGYNALSDLTGAGMMGGAYSGLGSFVDRIGGMDPVTAGQVNPALGKVYDANASLANASLANRGAIQDVRGGSYLDKDINAYMNPYTQGVVNNVQDDLQRSWQQQDQAQRANAAAAGAFGGSRHGVADALTASEYQRNAGQLSNQLWNQAYGAATNLMGDDLSRGLQANLANQGMDWNTQNLNANLGTGVNLANAAALTDTSRFNAANRTSGSFQNAAARNQVGLANVANALQAAGLNQNQLGLGLSALQSMGGLGSSMANFTQTQGRNLTDYGMAGMGAQQNAGNQYQQFEQAQLDDQYRRFLEARDWQANNFGQFGGMGLGAQGNTTTTGQAFGPSKGSQLIGAGLGIAGMGGTGGFGLWGGG